MNLNKCAVHIQTHPPHFKYTVNLINHIEEKNMDEKKVDVFIIFDNKKVFESFDKNIINKSFVKYLIMSEEIDNIKVKITETYQQVLNQLKKPRAIRKWGAGGYRNWVAVKRSYSILRLGELGYNYVWCMDTEALPLKKFSFHQIFENYIKNPYLLIAKSGYSHKGRCDKNVILARDLFKLDLKKDFTKKIIKCAYRQNAFWIMNTNYFKEFINEVINIQKKPISYFMTACEQQPYEMWLYMKNKDIDFIDFSDDFNMKSHDMQDNHLIMNLINKQNLEEIANIFNKKYFNICLSYRGLYIKQLKKANPYFLNLLNIQWAISNYQGT